ncbi:YdaU family protein [Moraxella osloensis]|uniref:YdaU family protein n=1 Tax=Faucicola osloensis TaxID=34062 RepID=UPI002004FB1E|nr:YdaU family protein [Moraxella osloensis]MCK6157364.1 YdaU family protein [Moraxella osloensis]
MHYYSHNINDFNNATIHLSVEEECMYHRALAWYYSNEKPLPGDKEKIYRYLRATTKKLQTAVNNILDDFFTEKEDGFHQSRCDSEIAEYQSKQAKAVEAGKASANARRKLNENKTDVEQDNDNRSTTVQQEINDRSTTVQPTKNQEPITNNQLNNSLSKAHEQKTADAVLEKAEQVKQANAQDIENWQQPSLDDMRSILFQAGFQGQLNQKDYDRYCSDFKVYFAEQAILGKPIATDSLRKNKLRDWIVRDSQKKPSYQKKSPQANEQRFGTKDDPLAVDVVWNQPVVPVSQMTYEEWEAEEKAKQAARDSANNKGFEVIE